MQRRAYGPTAWLIDNVTHPGAYAQAVTAVAIDGVLEVLPAEATVLVVCERDRLEAIGTALDQIEPNLGERPRGADQREVVIEVVYDGEDLADVSEQAGVGVAEVIDRHQKGVYTVEFCGFSPGFAYLSGLDPILRLPRRSIPRIHVLAGSVAIAAHYSAIYPSRSPGGWHLLGTTTAEIWNTERSNPALLTPGTTVRFERKEG
ncbi:MAG: allophanate hydrolase subunit 1 [Ilumatobacteraceae bacterium]|nr:allophanate hydrolase subunit 1 [Ilumatobacteraceae bacterium]